MRRVSTPSDPVVVVGAGCSTLITELIAHGHRSITAVDISRAALDQLAKALGDRAGHVGFITSDVCELRSVAAFQVWHDRATFHFLTERSQQRAYVERASDALVDGGHLVLSGFAQDGPEQCSGLDVARHSLDELVSFFDPNFDLINHATIDHTTPWGAPQRFVHTMFRRRPRVGKQAKN